eukprot:TRINITY_DN3517_c0_g1_i1.p1 TRINITY_DN3517_c0_g1~~TRINITY_DN3517_c0_g1_i1.p1  ORF type:complete len:670 (-),score=134.77 TRINITY_DN3517_c0_g1_i1:207-2144(-)
MAERLPTIKEDEEDYEVLFTENYNYGDTPLPGNASQTTSPEENIHINQFLSELKAASAQNPIILGLNASNSFYGSLKSPKVPSEDSSNSSRTPDEKKKPKKRFEKDKRKKRGSGSESEGSSFIGIPNRVKESLKDERRGSSTHSSRRASATEGDAGTPNTEVSLSRLILDDPSYINLVCNGLLTSPEFPSILFRYFEVNQKTMDLMSWVIHEEIENTKDMGTLLRGESLVIKLFLFQFFNDLGKKYMTTLLQPFVLDVVKMVDNQGSCDELQLLDRIDLLLTELVNSIDVCPLNIRECLYLLNKEICAKWKDAVSVKQMIVSILCLRFICPSITIPQFDQINVENDLPPSQLKALIKASKILQSLANGVQTDAKHAEFFKRNTEKMLMFIDSLIDEKQLMRDKRMIEASVKIIFPESDIKMAEIQIEKILSSSIINQTIVNELVRKENREIFLKLCSSSYDAAIPWKKYSDKKFFFSVDHYIDKQHGLFVFKMTGKFSVELKTFIKLVSDVPKYFKTIDSRVVDVECVEKREENNSDWLLELKMPFPYSNRECLITLFQESTDKSFLSFYTSIEREYQQKNSLRLNMRTSGVHLEVDARNPSYVKYTSFQQVELGSLPQWVFNNSANFYMKGLLKMRSILEERDT